MLLNHSPNHKQSTTRCELLALMTFTRHFHHYLVDQKFTKVSDHSALQWLHSFKDPDRITAWCSEKLATFDSGVRHRPSKSIGLADGLSSNALNSINAIQRDVPSTSLAIETPRIAAVINNHQKVTPKTVLLTASQLISKCLRGSPGHIYANSLRKIFSSLTNLTILMAPVVTRNSCHLVTKQKHFNIPTYSTLRDSLQRMQAHVEHDSFFRIITPWFGTRLDQLHWVKIKPLIQESFWFSPVKAVV